MKPNILIISFSPIRSDPRVMRQIQALENEYDLTVLGFGSSPEKNINFIKMEISSASIFRKISKGLMLLAKQYERIYWGSRIICESYKKLIGYKFDLIIANDIITLPLALKVAGSAPVVFDAHEYAPKEFENVFMWRLFLQKYITYLCKRYLPQARSSMTVCDSIAREYKTNFGVLPLTVMNCPEKQNLALNKTNNDKIKIVHHGIAVRVRKIELMIEMMEYLNNTYTLDLMLVPSDIHYVNYLKSISKKNNKIKFIDPVPLEEICPTLNKYDLGLFLLPPENFNYECALPNKFFEFIQARLAVVIGPSREMSQKVFEGGFGVVADEFTPQSVAKVISNLTSEEIDAKKGQSAIAADIYNADYVKKNILNIVKFSLANAAA